MKQAKVFLFFILFSLFLTSRSFASSLQYLMPDYYLGLLVRGILATASQVGYPQYEVLQVPEVQAKAQRALQKIYFYPAFNYTYDNIQIVVIRGLPEEPNGFAFGANIFITKSMIELLSENELTAVIAHELAHSEKAHNLQRMPLPLEATVFQLKNIAQSVKEGKWPKGKDLMASIQELIWTGGLAMELQADCIAAKQLEHMHSLGLSNQASDLIKATQRLLGYDVTKDTSEDPSAVRVRALLAKFYQNGSCDIFPDLSP